MTTCYKIDESAKLVKVIHGANDGVFALAGSQVARVRASLVDVFNIPPEALAFVNGEQVDANYNLSESDTLEFVKRNGYKGIRYPGGKKKLRKPIVEHLRRFAGPGIEYREPFFGGGAIGLEVLNLLPALTNVWINDRYEGMASYWNAAIHFPNDLKAQVLKFKPSVKAFNEFKCELLSVNTCPTSRKDIVALGLKTLAVHQMSFSGLGAMSGGPMSDIGSRWSPAYLCKQLDKAHRLFAAVQVHDGGCTCQDYSDLILNDSHRAVLYLDPPYFHRGAALYQYAFTLGEHHRLSVLLHHTPHNWLLSYDDCPEIKELYQWACVEKVNVTNSINGCREGKELLIYPRSA